MNSAKYLPESRQVKLWTFLSNFSVVAHTVPQFYFTNENIFSNNLFFVLK